MNVQDVDTILTMFGVYGHNLSVKIEERVDFSADLLCEYDDIAIQPAAAQVIALCYEIYDFRDDMSFSNEVVPYFNTKCLTSKLAGLLSNTTSCHSNTIENYSNSATRTETNPNELILDILTCKSQEIHDVKIWFCYLKLQLIKPLYGNQFPVQFQHSYFIQPIIRPKSPTFKERYEQPHIFQDTTAKQSQSEYHYRFCLSPIFHDEDPFTEDIKSGCEKYQLFVLQFFYTVKTIFWIIGSISVSYSGINEILSKL